jgi:undecaprenyl-diphosphatase
VKESRWASARLATTLKHRFEAEWTALPAAALRKWALFALFGVIAVVAMLYIGIALLMVTSEPGDQFAWEVAMLQLFEAGPVGFSTAVWLQTLGTDFMLLSVVLTTVGLAIWNRRPLLAVSIVLTILFMDAIVRVGWFSLARDRPDVIAQGLAAPGFHSFPSGHTAKTLALYGLLAAQWLRASHSLLERLLVILLLIGIALVVPFGRMRMGVHWPTDIIGGYSLAAVWLVFILLALKHEPHPAPRA